MIKRISAAAVLAIMLLTASLPAFALSDSPVRDVYNAGKALLFDTHNVSFSGTAVFLLDSVSFKTINAEYRQDNGNSRFRYDLTSPRKYGSEEEGEYESGYSVIVIGDTMYVVDKYYPGTCRILPVFDPQTVPVRRSFMMDMAVDLAELALSATEPALNENAVEISANSQEGAVLNIRLDESSITPLSKAAFNLCAQMVIQRLFSRQNFDSLPVTYDEYFSLFDYITPSQAIVNMTKRYDLQAMDVTVNMDGEGRLTGVTGAVSVALVLADGIPEAGDPEPHMLDFMFGVTVYDYGDTTVPPFDPKAEGLKVRDDPAEEAAD